MKAVRVPALLSVLFLFSVVLARAQDPNVDLMKKLYTKIGLAVGVGSNDPQTGEAFLVMANPGIVIDPNLDINTAEGRYHLAKSLDLVLNPNWIYGTRNTNVWSVYQHILTDKEPAAITPTAAQVTQYKKACKLVFKDCDQDTPGDYTDAWKRYVDKRNALAVIVKNAEDYRKNNHTDDLPADMANELQTATDDLDLIGNRATLQGAKAVIDTYNHIDPNVWWGELTTLSQTPNSETYNGAPFGKINVYPSYPVWLDMNRTWTKLTLNQNDLQQTNNSSSTSVGGGASFSLGLFSVGADYSHLEQRQHFKLDASGYTVTLEVMRITLDRPWMDEAVFESEAWKWLQGTTYYNKFISSGADATAGHAPPSTDIMPFLPTGLLLARRVSISANWVNDLQTFFHQHTSAGGNLGWGPFSFSGRYESDDVNTYHEAHAAGNTISWDAPQIIGFFVQVLPPSPHPYRCYHFPSDTNPIPADCANHLNLMEYNLAGRNFQMLQNPDLLIDKSKSVLREMDTSRATQQHQQPR